MTPRNEEGNDIAGDFHLHTTESDGTDTVEERVEQARELGLQAIAITDHDGISNDLPDRQTEVDGVEVITGVEAKAQHNGVKVDILGYYMDPDSSELNDLLREIREYRRERNEVMFDRLNDAVDVDLNYEDIERVASGQVGRPHFARMLVEKGVTESVTSAFEDYLNEDGDIYVPTEKVISERVIKAIHSARGVTSLAHPGRIDTDDESWTAADLVSEMTDQGLDSLEVWYPYGRLDDSRLGEITIPRARELAGEHGLLRTGGSDCHGSNSKKQQIGTTGLPKEDLQQLHEAANI